jgi:TatD DNase family protein
MFIDSHCHLDFPEFADLNPLLASCEAAGVEGFLVPATTSESWSNVIRLAHEFASIKIALGLHPYFLNQEADFEGVLQLLERYLNSEKVVALGEIGLDKWPEMPDYDFQINVFKAQLSLAKKLALPVVLHARKSEDDLLKWIRVTGFKNGGIVHAFNGSLEQAKRFIGYGFLLGIGGTVTYPRAQKARRVLQSLADEHFVLETDAPDMPLCGYQGQANSPIRIIEVAQSVAEIRQQSVAHVAQCTSANLQRVLPNWHKV